jgi:hypothetical protein
VFRKFEPALPVMEMALAYIRAEKVSVVSQFLEVARKIAKAYPNDNGRLRAGIKDIRDIR